MKNYFMAFLILAASGLIWAADEPNTPPAIQKHKPGEKRAANMPMAQMKGRGEIRENLAQRHEEYTKWLEKNYPDEAMELAQAKGKDPDRYFRLLKESSDKYGKLAYADRTNPELAKLLREDIDLKAQTEKKLAEVRQAADDKEKQELTAELQQLVSKRFDNIVAQKQIRYQELNQRLETLKKQIKSQESELDKLKAKKDQEVKSRVEELLSNTEKINWN